MLDMDDSNARAAYLKELAQRIIPSLDFFVFSLVAGVTLGIALLLDSQPVGVLAALMAPFLAPVIGLSLATVLGSVSFFFQSLGGIGIGSLLVFLGGVLAGLITKWLPVTANTQGIYYTHFSWANFAVLTIGAILTAYLFVRQPKQRPVAASIAMAYELYLPIGTAGFGLTSGTPHLWPDGVVVFAVHLAWSALAGTIVLLLLGFKPLGIFGYTFSTSLTLIGIVAVTVLSGIGTAVFTRIAMPPPTATPTLTPIPSATATLPPPPPTITPTLTRTLIPSRTPTITATPAPTPVYARINAGEFNGALIREQPDPTSNVVTSMLNGMLVEVLPEIKENQGIPWVHVRLPDGREGWILRSLLVTATPIPNW
jgi:uncharacterized membrane protein